jgi:hypothetical protein
MGWQIALIVLAVIGVGTVASFIGVFVWAVVAVARGTVRPGEVDDEDDEDDDDIPDGEEPGEQSRYFRWLERDLWGR